MFGKFKRCERAGCCPSLPDPQSKLVKLPEIGDIKVLKKSVEHRHQTNDRYETIGFGPVFAVGVWTKCCEDHRERWKIEGTYAIEANAEAHAEKLRNEKAGA